MKAINKVQEFMIKELAYELQVEKSYGKGDL